MRVLDASFAKKSPDAAPFSKPAPESGGSASYSPRGTSRVSPVAGDVPLKVVQFALTLSSAAFEAGPLEAMRGTVCLVDLGPTEKADAAPHGYRRRLTENVAFGWREGEVGGSSGAAPATAIFELPVASVTLTTRAFVQLTHLAPAAGGLDPKVYTHKTARDAEKFLAKDRKRLEKRVDDEHARMTAFADGGSNPPSAIVAWAVLPITELVDGPGGGVVRLISGATRVNSMFRVKETYAEAQVLDAAAASSHAMKNHKPIRCVLAFEVTPLATREAVDEAASVSGAPAPTLLASDPARGDAPAPAWWETGGDAEPRSGSRRDLFVYVDTTSIGRRKDTRVRVQLREDDLDIDARGARAVVVAEAGDSSDARSSSSSDEEEEEEATTPSAVDAAAEDDDDGAAPGVPTKKVRPRGRPRRASWSHLSTGKAKGGAWCHEVRVRLPARLNPGHHLVFSVFGRDPEPASSGWGSLGGKVGPEEPLGHAVLPLATARETLAPEIALAALPMRGSKRLGGAGGAGPGAPGAPRRGAAAGESAEPSSSSSSGTWVGVNGGIENGHDVSLPAVRDLLPKYMQENVRAHMKYVDDKGKPCVFARLRLRSNVHTSDARVGALYASSAAAAAADEAHADDEFSVHKVKTTAPSRSRGGSSLGGASAASRAAVKTATRELCAALRDVHRASAEQLLAHFPAIMHLLLTLIAAPPPAIAAQVAADAALVVSAAEARATAARAEAAARLAAANAAATAAKAADGAYAAETKPASSPEPSPPPPPPPPRVSPTPDSPASDSSVETPASSPGTFGVVSVSASASPSPSPPTAPSPTARARPPGLVEQAFAALVRVAARTQTLEPDAAAADFERSPPLEAYAARVFDDARCVADWRGAARRALARDAAASGEEHDSASTDAAREIPEPLFPRLATLYASRLRETASTARDEPDAAREAADARRVCWFVLALIARSASLDAARRFREKKTERRDRRRASSDASDEAKNEKRDDFSSSKTTFAAAPSGPATPAPGDARVEALVEMARVVSAETLAPPSASSPPGDARLRRGMNLGLARLCASLTEIAGPPPGNETFSSEDDDAFSSGDEKAPRDGDEKSSRRWSRGGDGVSRDETAPLAPTARRVASSHVRRLMSFPAAWPFLYEFCVAACASPRFVAAAAGAARGTGWSPEDLAFERLQEEASALLDAAAAERGGAGDFLSSDEDAETPRRETETRSPKPSDALVAAVASATFAGLRSAEDDRRDAAAGALAAILSRHARDASLQSQSARAAVAAVHAPLLRLLVARRDEIFDAPVPGGAGDASIPAETRRNVLASFLSLARDADQRALWTWLARDPEMEEGGDASNDPFFRREKMTLASTFVSANPFVRARALSAAPARRASRPPRLVSFLRLLCDALEAFAFRADEAYETSEAGDESNRESKANRADASSIVAEGHRSAAVTLVVLELLRRGGRVIAEAQKLEDAFWAKHGGGAARRRGGGGAVGSMFGRGGRESRSERETRAREEARAARAAKKLSPAVTFFEGSLGVLLAAMRADQSEEAWRALAAFLRATLWDRRADLLRTATYDPEAKTNDGRESSFFDAPESGAEIESDLENAFPPVPAPPPGATPHAFLESASALLLKTIASSRSKATRAEATSCVRALLEACVDLTGSAVALRPTLTYALCAALYSPLGAAARRGALAFELKSLREPRSLSSTGGGSPKNINPRKEKRAREDWYTATRDVLDALDSAEARLRALARAATGPRASPDVETVVETEIAVARAFAWAPAAHCKALRSLSARLEAAAHWVEAAEAAATAAWTAMRALNSAARVTTFERNSFTDGESFDRCVWRPHDAGALAATCASLGETFSVDDEKQSAGARCGVEEISEEKILEHLAEATRLFVKGGHLEAAVRVAKTVLPAWERRRAFGDLARAHEGVAGVYRALHAAPPAGAAGSGAFGLLLPPPPGPPPPPATHYRVRLVGDAWDALGLKGKTWIHREPRDRTLGEMLRSLQASLTPRSSAAGSGAAFPAISPLPPSGDAGDGACVHVTAVEPAFEASRSWLRRARGENRGEKTAEDAPRAPRNDALPGDTLASVGGSGSGSGSTRLDPLVLDDEDDDDAAFPFSAKTRATDAEGFVPRGGGFGFPTARAFVHDAPFTREEKGLLSTSSAGSVSGPALALRQQWRRRTTSRVAGRFPGLRARLLVTGETVTEMPPCVSTAEMLDAQRRAILNAADAWESLTRAGASTSSSVLGGVGSAEKQTLDDVAKRNAAESALGALQRSLQGSLAAGVNGGVPTIVEAFFPVNVAEAPEMSQENRDKLVDSLEAFVATCVFAVETHGRAARDAAAKANVAARELKAAGKRGREAVLKESAAAAAAAAASMERMQGMFVRCAAEVRRDVATAVARAEEWHAAGDGEGSEKSA